MHSFAESSILMNPAAALSTFSEPSDALRLKNWAALPNATGDDDSKNPEEVKHGGPVPEMVDVKGQVLAAPQKKIDVLQLDKETWEIVQREG